MSTSETDTGADTGNRSRLLRAAADAFAEHGFDGVSLRAIADDAGVSFQLISYYFGAKEDLWLATVESLYQGYYETGLTLGFTESGDVREQFRDHLRRLMTYMLKHPHMRKIWTQEYLAQSERYKTVLQPKMRHFVETISQPYYEEVVRLGIVKRFTPQETSLLFSGILHCNVVHPYHVELVLGESAGSAESIERQVDLIFRILTEEPPAPLRGASRAAATRAASRRGSRGTCSLARCRA